MYLIAKEFDKQVAIITGAGQGIGYEIATQLARKGASIILNDENETLASQAAERIVSNGGSCVAIAGDASAYPCIQLLIQTAMEVYGGLDLVIANAGISMHAPFLDFPLSDFDRLMRVNLQGTFFLTQAAANQMIRLGKGGSILLMSSVNAHQANRNLAAYSMSKAAIEMLAKTLVIDLSPNGITINAIAPGATLTERTMEFDDYRNEWSKITPMGRPAEVSDISNAALFLLSPRSRHITGQSIVVDGGWTSVSPLPADK